MMAARLPKAAHGLSPELLARVHSRREQQAIHRLNDAYMTQVERRMRAAEQAFNREVTALQADLEAFRDDLVRRAEEVLAASPNFDALHASPAFPIIRQLAARHDLAVAAIMRPQRRNPKATRARRDAVHAVADRLGWSDEAIGVLFEVSGATIKQIRRAR